jgi:hypothetical protein
VADSEVRASLEGAAALMISSPGGSSGSWACCCRCCFSIALGSRSREKKVLLMGEGVAATQGKGQCVVGSVWEMEREMGEDCKGREKPFALWLFLAEGRWHWIWEERPVSKERKGLGWWEGEPDNALSSPIYFLLSALFSPHPLNSVLSSPISFLSSHWST